MVWKNSLTKNSLIWLDWLIFFLIALTVAIISPFSFFGNVLLTIMLAIPYRFTLRKVMIRIFPDLYRTYSCSGCSSIVPADAPTCPGCNLSFDDSEASLPDSGAQDPGPPGSGDSEATKNTKGTGIPSGYRSNVVLISCLLTVVLTVAMVFFFQEYWLEAVGNLLLVYILSVVLVFFDARGIGAGRSEEGWGRISPAMWMVFMVVVWIIAFPLYLIKRKRIFSGNPVIEDSPGEEFSRADLIGSFLIPFGAPVIGAILAFYYLSRGKNQVFILLLSASIVIWFVTMIMRGRF